MAPYLFIVSNSRAHYKNICDVSVNGQVLFCTK